MSKKQLKKWVKQTARVPRGYLRYQVLMLLKETPMSGAELAESIEEATGGEYRPSSGSIYPVLKKLHNIGIIEKLPMDEGMQRYRLTDKGHSFFEENVELLESVRERLDAVEPPFAGIQNIPSLSKHVFRISQVMMKLSEIQGDDWSPKVTDDVEKILSSVADQLEGVLEDIRNEQRET